MNLSDLTPLSPDQVASMSEEELVAYLSPLIPLARAPYTGKKSSVATDVTKLSPANAAKTQAAQLKQILAYANAHPDKH